MKPGRASMIVCCGEALIDFLPRQTTEGDLAYQPMNGGSIFNTAIGLGRLDNPTGFFTGLSTDFFGDMLRAGLTASLIKDKRKHLARLNRLIAQADILKISDEDVAWMTGKNDLAAAAKKWLKAGAKIVTITKGGEGFEAYTKRFAISRPAVKVKVA